MNQITPQTPIELDVSFKYICPGTDCNISHWIFLREAKTKNFKIVCECGTVFKPKRIKNIRLIYANQKSIKNKIDNQGQSDRISNSDPIVKRAISIMKSLGYSEKESFDSISSACILNNYTDPKILVKTAISNFGENNV